MLFSALPYLCRRFFALLLSSPGSLFHCSTSAYLPPCLLVFPSTVPFPPSEGAQFPYIFYSPSEGAQKPHCPESHLYPHFPTHRAIPTFRRWAGSPHFLLTFRRCAEAALPRKPLVAAFPHPSCHSHLPKVSSFPTFSTHLPKVRRSPIHRTIPTFRRCAVSPHFLLTFRRCAEAALPLELPVASFPHPPYHSHLPKVCSFPTFSTHLPKVRRSRTATKTTCSRISPSIVPFPPSGGGQFPHIFYSPSEGAQKHCRPESRL